MFKKITAALALLLVAISVAHASIYTMLYIVAPIPTAFASHAMNFNIASGTWKRLDELPWAYCFSCTFTAISSNDVLRHLTSAYATIYMKNAGDARLVSFYYDWSNPSHDEKGRVWKRDYPDFSTMNGCNVCSRFSNITAAVNQLFVDRPGDEHQFTIEVTGVGGEIYGAKLALDYAQPL